MFGLNEFAWFSLFAATALKSAAVLSGAWLVSVLLRKRSAAARHQVWTAAFAALLALPFLAVSLPPLHITGAIPIPNLVFQATATATGQTSSAEPVASAPHAPSKPVSRRPGMVFWMMLLWAAGTTAALLQTLVAAAAMGRIRRQALRAPDGELRPLTEALGLQHPVELLEAHSGSMPMTFGVMRPAVFMPSDAAGWSEERRRMVLLHELAHVRRGDVATHLLARTALNLYWWNPLAWFAWRMFLKERERATDDLVLSAGARASEYAGHLLEVARTMQASPAIGWAAVAMARPSQLEGRLLAILDGRVNRATPGRLSGVTAALLAVAIVAPLAAVQPQDGAGSKILADVDGVIRTANAQKNHEILENAAKAAEAMKQYDVAKKLLDSAVAIRQQVSGDHSVEYGQGLIKLGDLELSRNRRPSAVSFYTKAVEVLGSRPEAAPALQHLGIEAMSHGDYEAAIEYFQQMQVADPTKAGRAMTWMAVVRQRQGQFAESESLFRGAMALQGENTVEAATTLDLYANLLKQIERTSEAALMQTRAEDARRAARTATVNTAGTGAYKVSGGVSAPLLIYKAEPAYTEEARAAKYQGTVTLYVEIGPDGLAHNIRVLHGLGLGLDEKAIDAVSVWKFKPGMKDGQPVTVAASIEVNFRLL